MVRGSAAVSCTRARARARARTRARAPVGALCAALALALALAARAFATQTATANCTQVTPCSGGASGVRKHGVERVVVVAWRGEAERAAAALLVRLLEEPPRALCRVALCHAPGDLCALASDDTALLVGLGWSGERCAEEGHRLSAVGRAYAPTAPRLHLRLARPYRSEPRCVALAGAPAALAAAARAARCGFPAAGACVAYAPPGWSAAEASAPLPAGCALESRPRATLLRLVRDATHSFPFVDAELWADEPDVALVRDAFGPGAGAAAAPATVEPLLYAEDLDLEAFAPPVLRALLTYAPPPRLLRRSLEAAEEERGGRGGDGAARGEAALRIARELDLAGEKCGLTAPSVSVYRAFAFFCDGDREEEYLDATTEVMNEIAKLTATASRGRFVVELLPYSVDCLDGAALRARIETLARTAGAHRALGAVAGGAGFAEAALYAERSLAWTAVAYDAQPAAAAGVRVAASAEELGAALARTVSECGWRRVALLSEATPTAEAAARRLRAAAAGPLREMRVEAGAPAALLRETLRALSSERARVFVVNAGVATAAALLAAAEAEGLTPARGRAWVLREWDGPAHPPPALLPLLALRVAPRSLEEAEAGADGGEVGSGRLALARLWPRGEWPRLAVPLADALVTLTLGFERLTRRFPETRFDHQATGTVEQFRRVLNESDTARAPLVGVRGRLAFDARGGARAPRVLLEVWQTPGADAVRADACPAALRALGDGAGECALPAGGGFAPVCLTAWAAGGAPALLLAALLAGRGAARVRARARRAASARLLRLRAEAACALLARRGGAVRALAAHLVDPEEVRRVRELGAGRFGRVWLARLGDARLVAAKEARPGSAPSEEGDLLLEAATLARLDHPHVVRLVGVCVARGAPLVLTEPASHGDLLRYLRARRPGDEHVSAEALTRLAREAALALAYLARRGLVHCDVRAANCLVDERRSLKLADFGMARWAGSGGGGGGGGGGAAEPEEVYYRCERRGLFPVLWMAPESLARGAFSSASDVWALGVVALELSTLGARPFGALPPARAVELVKAGGHAPLPAAASRDVRRLARWCWRHEAAARPDAAAVARWLAERPRALAPSPSAPAPPPGDADSGFGEPDAPAAEGAAASPCLPLH